MDKLNSVQKIKRLLWRCESVNSKLFHSREVEQHFGQLRKYIKGLFSVWRCTRVSSFNLLHWQDILYNLITSDYYMKATLAKFTMPGLKPHSIFLNAAGNNRSWMQSLCCQTNIKKLYPPHSFWIVTQSLSHMSMEGTEILCIGRWPAGLCPVSSLRGKNLMNFLVAGFSF